MTTYYFKDKHILGDKITYTYVLVQDGKRIGVVRSKKEAEAWFRAQPNRLERD